MAVEIVARPNGPYLVSGDLSQLELRDGAGNLYDLGGKTRIFLCRCGASTTKPFCGGQHSKIGFQAAQAAVASEGSTASASLSGASIWLGASVGTPRAWLARTWNLAAPAPVVAALLKGTMRMALKAITLNCGLKRETGAIFDRQNDRPVGRSPTGSSVNRRSL